MPKYNGYLKEWSVSLRTDCSSYGTYDNRVGSVDGLRFRWRISWLDILPPDFKPNGVFRVTHRFSPLGPVYLHNQAPGTANTLPPSNRSCYFTSNLASRSAVSTYPNPAPATGTTPTTGVTQFAPGFINALTPTSSSCFPTNTSSGVTTSYDEVVNYTTPKFEFLCYSPENFTEIVIHSWEMDNAIDKTVAAPPVWGVHTFTFKLIE